MKTLTTQRTSHPQHSQVAKLVDAMDDYSTMCKNAYSVCGHYNGTQLQVRFLS